MEKIADAKKARRHYDYSCVLDDSEYAVCRTIVVTEQ
jgi:hypothetical protein